MQTVTVTAREKFPYDGIDRAVGDAFEATVDDARILKMIGRIEDVELPAPVMAYRPVSRRQARRREHAAGMSAE